MTNPRNKLVSEVGSEYKMAEKLGIPLPEITVGE